MIPQWSLLRRRQTHGSGVIPLFAEAGNAAVNAVHVLVIHLFSDLGALIKHRRLLDECLYKSRFSIFSNLDVFIILNIKYHLFQ
jgi:hypothetical protein